MLRAWPTATAEREREHDHHLAHVNPALSESAAPSGRGSHTPIHAWLITLAAVASTRTAACHVGQIT